jgi:AAA family ATP:ADP antiporter
MNRSFSTRWFKVQPGEGAVLAWSCAYFFCLLAAYYILRPQREAMAAAGDVRNLKWLYLGTLAAMLVSSLVFAAITTRFSRGKFIPYVYRFFMANLLIFYGLLLALPESGHGGLGRVFFVWVSVFALFVVSVFWSFMADIFTNPQGKRLFAVIAVGGTLGQILGSFVSSRYAEQIGAVHLLLVSVLLLEAACWCVYRLNAVACAQGAPAPRAEVPVGGGAFDGLKRVARSPYLLGICLFILCYTITSTFLYFTKIEIGTRQTADADGRVAFFANIDFYTGVLTVLAQIFLTSRLIARFGVGVTLGVLPLITLAGFALLGYGFVRPETLNIVAVLVAFEAVRRAGNFAISRPAREVLYTVVPRPDKYKSKNVIDTFVYRGGDQVGAWTYDGFLALGLSSAVICFSIVPLAAGWFVVALLLGRRQQLLAGPQGPPGA